jgi:outer membrane protein assembly factor BamB
VPDEGLLLVQTSLATLHAIDAETGRIVWSAEFGDPRRPSQRPCGNGREAPPIAAAAPDAAAADADAAPAADNGDAPTPAARPAAHVATKTDDAAGGTVKRHDKVVAVVNGSTLYLLSRSDGTRYIDPKNNIPWKLALRSAPVAGPLVTDDMVYVPVVGNQIECYSIYDSRKSPGYLTGSGRNDVPPVLVGDRVAWPSDTGVIHITAPNSLSVRHRIDTSGPILSMIAAWPPLAYAGSVDGYLYCVNENSGEVLWKFTLGSSMRTPPIAIKDVVYAIVEDGGLHRISSGGHDDWFNPAPRHFLAASPTKVYATDGYRRLVVINAATGATMDTVALPSLVQPIVNTQSDRIIFSSAAGLVQSLHEPELAQPENYIPPKPKQAEEPAAPKARPAKAAAKAEGGDDAGMPAEKPAPKPKPAPKAPKKEAAAAAAK